MDRALSSTEVENQVALGLRAGLTAGLLSIGVVAVSGLSQFLAYGYPLVLLPLVAIGIIVELSGQPLRRLVWGALIGGIVGGALCTAGLWAGVNLLGDGRFSLLGAASAPPIPPLPRVQLVGFLSWPQHDVFLGTPILSLLVLGVARVGRRLTGSSIARLTESLARIPAPVGRKLSLGYLLVGLSPLAVGWIGFSAIEEVHLRGHTLQVQVHWLGHLQDVEQAFDRLAVAASLSATDGQSGTAVAESATELTRLIAHLREGGGHQNLFVPPTLLRQTAALYAPYLDRLEQTATTLATRATPLESRAVVARDGRAIVGAMRNELQTDATKLVDETDLTHHMSLIAMLVLIGAAIGLGIAFGQAVSRLVIGPLRAIFGQVSAVSAGDFSKRVSVPSRDELGQLADAINRMTAELDRLYVSERAARESAEALAAREHALADAREFLTHTIVHDLKNPLTVVTGFSELLQSEAFGPLTPEQSQMVRHVSERSTVLVELVDGVLNTFRTEKEALPLSIEPVDLVGLVEQAAASGVPVAGRAPEILRAADAMLASVDPRLVQRVVSNLVDNAYKYAGPTAHIQIAVDRHDETSLVISVADDGPGIPVADREHIFERFVQGKDASAGVGLGLAFCRLIVERHDGRIWADDSPLGGARLSFTVPATVAVPAIAAVPVATSESESHPTRHLNGPADAAANLTGREA